MGLRSKWRWCSSSSSAIIIPSPSYSHSNTLIPPRRTTKTHKTVTIQRNSTPRGMSDSSFAAVSRYRGFLEVIDAEWMADALSDDELDVPAVNDLFLDDDDDDDDVVTDGGAQGAGGVAGVGKRLNLEDRWGDLGLEHLQPE